MSKRGCLVWLLVLVGCAGRANADGHVARASTADRSVSFVHDVLPVLARAGCSQGACHGTPTGKNGFRLSLRGYDPALDWMTLTREVGTRRVNPLAPDESLLLLKGSGRVAHEGGKRLARESAEYAIMRDWIAQGMPGDVGTAAKVVALDVGPKSRVIAPGANAVELAEVNARFADGMARDVRGLARYSSTNEGVAKVDAGGVVSRVGWGETTILVQYGSAVATTRIVFRGPVDDVEWVDPPVNNEVDQHVFAKLRLLNIRPSELTDDATFCRRVYYDVIGVPPTPDELRAFVGDKTGDKRSRLIDALLARPEYVDYWALKWSDRLGCNQRFTGIKGAYTYHRWIREQVAANVPLDRFAREVVTAQGGNYVHPAASFYRRVRTPEDAAESVSQLFLGVRLQCARCHNHVSERWTQDDYYGMAAFFSQVRYKNGPQTHALYNKEETVYLDGRREVKHPRTGQVMAPKALGSEASEEKLADRRVALAEWMTAPENPFFARAAANRIWYHLLGRGIVDPVDDLRDSNPPASEELLDYLSRELVASEYDAKALIRLICNSRTYQLSSEAKASNAKDEVYFSHARVRLLPAEAILDALSRATEVEESLFGMPPGTRAAQIPDGELPHMFLRTFGQPLRSVACECERGTETTLEQGLQIVNGRTVHEKIQAPENRIGRLLKAGVNDSALIEELYLATLCRWPTVDEAAICGESLSGKSGESRRKAAEDLLWALVNHPEFLFQH